MANDLPPEIYVTFSGSIDDKATQRIFDQFPIAVNSGVKTVHFLIQSFGGIVSEGIALHNYLTNLPLQIITYNCGSVESIAVLLYLVGEVRKCSRNSTFLIHKTRFSFVDPATALDMRTRANSAELDDQNTDAILRRHIEMPEEEWSIRDRGDLRVSAEDAVKFGLSHEIEDFSPPEGTNLFNI